MKKTVVGMIAEYNPFHNGHRFQIAYAKERLHADYCVVAMSGNYVQRGEPAIVEKTARAKMAIAEGADLVLEIPFCYSTGSLDAFAYGAISLLNNLGVISQIVFGSECGDISLLRTISDAMCADSVTYQILREGMAKGMQTDLLCQTVLCELSDDERYKICDSINQPNNMLGILYLTSLHLIKSSITPTTHFRLGQAYNNAELLTSKQTKYASATAIRKLLAESKDYCKGLEQVSAFIPNKAFSALSHAIEHQRIISTDDYWPLLSAKLTNHSGKLEEYNLVSPSAAAQIEHKWMTCSCWGDLAGIIAECGHTVSTANRMLMHILFGVTDSHLEMMMNTGGCNFTQILAQSHRSLELMELINNNAVIPVRKIGEDSSLISKTTTFRINQNADEVYTQLATRGEKGEVCQRGC